MFGLFGRRRDLEVRVERMRLDLARIEGASSTTNLLLAVLVKQGITTMSQLSDVIAAINDATNQVATRIDNLIQQVASLSQAPTPEQIAELVSIRDHLRAMGQDPGGVVSAVTAAMPPAPVQVPAPAPAPTSDPVATTPVVATPVTSDPVAPIADPAPIATPADPSSTPSA